ncbi:MAG TPA: rhomboid family intramembrane serine protease [Methylomirabilota bacterium]|nr:rhomboid family intramembrane serine protease [Methylomirabilota bacterium]HVN09764.1 rhomboid family intramembrane serine protease [Patescibacteria group bacterium]
MSRDFRMEYRFNWRREFSPAIRWLIVANCAVFVGMKIASMATSGDADRFFALWFGLIPTLVVPGLRVWTLATYLFLHATFWHLLFNMFTLWMFGRDLEPVWGPRRFLFYYFLTGIGAGVCVVLANLLPAMWGQPQPVTVTVGASGAIYGILMACGLLFPDRQVWLIPLPVMISMRMFVLIWGAIAFFSTLEGPGTGISHVAHLGGLLVGYVYIRRGSFFYTARNQWTDWKQRRLRKKFEVYMRDHRNEPPSGPGRWMN